MSNKVIGHRDKEGSPDPSCDSSVSTLGENLLTLQHNSNTFVPYLIPGYIIIKINIMPLCACCLWNSALDII